MVLLLLLQPHYPQTASFGHALALGLAVVSGPLAGWAAYRFILPVTLQGRLQGLRSMMVHELQDMAATPGHARDGRIWRARLYHRLLRLVRMSEQAGGQLGAQAAECGLAALHVGRAIQALHQLSGKRPWATARPAPCAPRCCACSGCNRRPASARRFCARWRSAWPNATPTRPASCAMPRMRSRSTKPSSAMPAEARTHARMNG